MSDNADQYYFGGIKEFNLDQIECEILNESVYLDVFAGSDLRLKKNIVPIKGALSKVLQLEGVTYEWSDAAPHQAPDGFTHAGLIAQDVASVMPELVRSDEKSGFLAINYSKLVSYLVEAVKDLHKIVEAQEGRIQSLEAKQPKETSH